MEGSGEVGGLSRHIILGRRPVGVRQRWPDWLVVGVLRPDNIYGQIRMGIDL